MILEDLDRQEKRESKSQWHFFGERKRRRGEYRFVRGNVTNIDFRGVVWGIARDLERVMNFSGRQMSEFLLLR